MANIRSFLVQLGITLIANIGPFIFGLHIGWIAPYSTPFQTSEYPFGRQLTLDEVSWLASLPTVGVLVGMPLYGCLLHRVTRRTTLFLAVTPHIIIFGSLWLFQDILTTMIMRFLCGVMAAGSIIVTPVYIGECVESKRRGLFCGFSSFFICLGFATAYFVNWYAIQLMGWPYAYSFFQVFCLIFPIIFFGGWIWFPESPVRLLITGDKSGAEKSLKCLRGGSAMDIEEEIAALEAAQKAGEPTAGEMSGSAVRSAVFIILGIMTTQQLCGISPINAYMFEIVADLTAYPDSTFSIIFSVLQMIASVIAPILLCFFGRRSLLLSSGVAITASLVAVAYCKHPFAVYAMGFFVSAYTVGFGTVPFVLLPELLPPHARGMACAVVGTWIGFLSFITTKVYPIAAETLSHTACFMFFAVSSLCGTVFVYLFLFETRGMTSVEIYKKLKKGRRSEIPVA